MYDTTTPSSIDTLALEKTVCPRCEAKPGDSCVTVSGKKTEVHSPRVRPLALAYSLGYEAGNKMGKSQAKARRSNK